MTDEIVSVGVRTGWLLGLGVDPMVFELPNSKMLFRVEPAIDFTGAKSVADVYHDRVELPVEPSVDSAIERFGYSGDPFSREFLSSSDPLFRRVLTDGSR